MKQNNILVKLLLAGALGSVYGVADMTVDKSGGVLTVTSTISGTVIAKVIGPDDEVIVDEKYNGSSFSWTPSGADGAYRYDVRVVPIVQESVTSGNDINSIEVNSADALEVKSDYAGGIIEVIGGQMIVKEEGL